ncbi:MAG: efflux RND transporter permease subunit [Acidobacteriota bacterium]
MEEPKITERVLPKFSIRRPVTVTMILIAVLVIGSVAYQRIKLDLFPSGFSPPFLGVYVPYRDANPKEIEEQIVKPLEGELKTVKDLKRIFSNSMTRGVWFWLEFAQGTNMDLAYAQVTDRIERGRPLIPDEIEHIRIRRFRDNDEPIIYMGVSYGENINDPYYVTDKFIKQAMDGIKGVANVELFGLREKYIQIVVNSDKVKTYNVNLYTLMQRLMQDNFSISSGYVYVGKKKFLLRSTSKFKTLEDIQNIEIRKGVKLSNIADVKYDFDEEQSSLMRVDGKLAAGIVAYKESEANTVEVCRNIVNKLKSQFKNRPELKGVDYFIFWDQGKMINESITNVQTTMMWGGFFAFLILYLFLRKKRITIMLTLAIPLSLLVSIMVIYSIGWTLNGFTMMGLMVSIGLVVDNAIVITENIYRFNGLGYGLKRSAIIGASEVGLAIIMATLTTIVVFVPLMVMGGDSGMSFYLTRIGAPVIFALAASLFIALIFIPLASTKSIPKNAKVIQASHSKFAQIYQNGLVKVLKHRFDFLLLIILIIASQVIPQNNMKKSDSAQGGPRDARIICNFPPDYDVDKVDKTLDYIAKKIREKEDIYHIDHISTRARSFHGRIEVYLKPDRDKQWYQVLSRKIKRGLRLSKYRRLTREELTEDIKKNLPKIPGVRLRTSWREQGGGDDNSVSFTLRGYDTTVLEGLALELEKQIKLVDGVLSVETDTETGNDEVHVTVDRDKAYKVGVNPNYIGQLVAFNLRRRKISNYQTPGKEIPIYVKSNPESRDSIAKLKNTFIATDSGGETNLASISDFTFHKSQGSIRRENGKSFLELKVFIGDVDMKKLSAKLTKILKEFKFPTGYFFEEGGRGRRFREQDSDLSTALIFSIIFVFLIMGVLFESFILPLSVLIAIPAAFVGSYWLMYITGTTFEIMAGIGLVVLIGVVVNNAIVFIDLINQYRKDNMQREQAILVAGMHRFRPILMTALTTIFGLLPMAIGNTGLVGIPYAPMGITLIGGLISSTFLTLFAVPIFYTYFDDLRIFFGKFLKRF